MKIRDIIARKGSAVYHVSPDTSVYDAIAKMAEYNVGALVVLRGDKLAGIISERDYSKKVILKGRSSRETRVEEIMSEDVICITPEHEVDDGLAIMTEGRVRHLPVLSEGRKVTGMISIGDLVKAIVDQKNVEIEDLKSYIAGEYPG